jgi:GDP/UDP-N,N'-diacetylbacillosamine 2-epimerase (hydrolysing)
VKRKICVFTGGRAEYGILLPLLKNLQAIEDVDLTLLVSGMHLSQEFGLTYKEIEKDGFECNEKVEMILSSDTPTSTCKSMGLGMIGFSDALTRLNPDFLVVLGDRFESMSVVTSAMVCRMPVAHIQGGEMTLGAIDDHMRHCITKMSYIHFVTTSEYMNRVIQLGEAPNRVFNVGALNVDSMKKIDTLTKKELEIEINFPIDNRTILVTFHPITLENNTSEGYFSKLIEAIKVAQNIRVIFTYTNADTEGRVINEMIDRYVEENPKTSVAFSSLGQLKYISCLKYIGAVVGNSSSGVIETPTFKIPTVNIGDRELGRIMAKNVICCNQDTVSIKNAINKSLSLEFKVSLTSMINPYEKKDTAISIADILTKIDIPDSIKKTFYDIKQ